MGAVTYPDAEVEQFINSHMVPLQVGADEQPISSDFNVTWTPTILVLDSNGKEHLRNVGFLPPDEMIPTLLLGIGKAAFENRQLDGAIDRFQEVLSRYPKSFVAPEALYLRWVAQYKKTHDAKQLKEAYEQLTAKYPQSAWAKRAQPYRLL